MKPFNDTRLRKLEAELAKQERSLFWYASILVLAGIITIFILAKYVLNY